MTKSARMSTDAVDPGPVFWKGKRILIVSPEAWGAVRLSKHHYASKLKDHGAQVFFLGPDSTKENEIRILSESEAQPVLLFRPPPLRGIRFLPQAVRAWLEARQMRRLASVAGGPFDLLWNFDLYRFRWITDRTYARTRIVHAMDLRNPAHFPGPARRADLVIVVSATMAKVLVEQQHKVLRISHGWLPRERRAVTLPAFKEGIRVGYLGNLAMPVIDWSGILKIASDHSIVQIHLIGPLHGTFGEDTHMDPTVEARLRALPNVHLTGPVPFNEVPKWLEAMDILLIAYDPEHADRNVGHPHKLLEYLASGKVVLSNYLEDQADLEGLVVMAPQGRRITPLFDQVLRELEDLNTPGLQAKRKAYAMANSYDRKVAQVAARLSALWRSSDH